MAGRFYVIDEENLTSWSSKTEAAEVFKTHALAKKRALELAELNPGETFYICPAIAMVRCPVGKPEIKDAAA